VKTINACAGKLHLGDFAFVLILLVALTSGCSKRRDAKSEAKLEDLPEQQVVDIVNAVNSKNVAQVSTLLKTNPKLVGAKFQNGGPVNGWPLLVIAASGNDKPMVELLLRSGADVNDVNYSGETALHYAAAEGSKDIVKMLIDKKADVNAKTEIGGTALKMAAEAGKNDVVALLKQHGAKE
jgi:ankyrin repeat protein